MHWKMIFFFSSTGRLTIIFTSTFLVYIYVFKIHNNNAQNIGIHHDWIEFKSVYKAVSKFVKFAEMRNEVTNFEKSLLAFGMAGGRA